MLNNIPIVTKNILIINVLVFIVTQISILQGSNLDMYLAAHYINSPLFQPYQVITHMFSHANLMHIFFNMFMIVIFGSHLERILGTKRYFIFYFASGIGAFLLYNSLGVYEIYNLKNQLISQGYDIQKVNYYFSQLDFESIHYLDNKPRWVLDNYGAMVLSSMVGASGAAFGLSAAFAYLFPNTELYLMFIPVPVKAKYLIGGYFAYEVYKSFNPTYGDTTAHLAHVGGAIVGFAMIWYWRKFDKQNFY